MQSRKTGREMTQIAVRVPADEYAEYKAILYRESTTPTADIVRRILEVVEKGTSKKQN